MSMLFAQLRSKIHGFGPNSSLKTLDLLDSFTLAKEGNLRCVYAPFDHVPASARIAVVGITPGFVQAQNALIAAGEALRAGKSNRKAMRMAKLTSSFSGSQTRSNLVSMLDNIGLASRLGLRSCETLFNPEAELVHFTSALRYPVFVNGDNYNGTQNMLKSQMLRTMIETHLADEVRQLGATLWLPLGPKPAIALRHLVKIGALPPTQLLDGMPHPSGLNGERIAAFLGRLAPENASAKTNVIKLVAARNALAERISQLSI